MSADKAAWVKRVFQLDVDAVPQTVGAGAAKAAGPGAAQPEEAAAPADTKDLVGAAPIIPIIIAGLKTLTGELTAKVTIANNTQFTLTLDSSSLKLESGDYKSKPAHVIKPGDPPSVFTVHSTPILDIPIIGKILPDINHCEGTIRYFVGDEKTVLSCFFINPRLLTDPLGTNDAKVTLTGPNAATLKASADKTHGSDGTFDFNLDGPGGGKPTPGNESGVAASCRVSIVNQTQQTVFLRKQDKAAGDYVTNPATSIAPGGKTDFVFAETPNSKDGGCRGLMTWEVADPKQAQWDLMWDNQKGAKNLSASFLDPKSGPFHTLDQIDQGDENVPVTFTLSGGGGGGGGQPVPTGKPQSCVITIKNETKVVLNLLGSSPDDGKFDSAPPKSIAAGASATVKMTGPADATKAATGSLSFDVADPKTGLWVLGWSNPPGSKNNAFGSLESEVQGFATAEEVDDGDQDVAFTYTISGGPQTPPAGKEPTSCAIMVTNGTKSVLTLKGQKAESGVFKRTPPATLAPGASALITFTGPPEDPSKGAKGSMTWELGDPKITTWTTSWDNPPGDKNTASADPNPLVPGIETTATVAGAGDDDVPFTFTIAGDPGGQHPGKGTSCTILVKNATKSALILANSFADSGTFTTPPPSAIPAGGTATVAFAGPKDDPQGGSAGSMEWSVGDPAVAHCTMKWDNPVGGQNSADIKLDPDANGMATEAKIGEGDAAVPVTFTVSGEAAPPPKEEEFAAPPKSKQPTLRKGDESPDGWVEYAQDLLNKNGAKLTVNGKFDGAMDKAVKAFQGQNKCQVDGTIGNETWSMLRKGPKEVVGTDGRKPHSFEETGAQARFYTEDSRFAGYIEKEDTFYFFVTSTGEKPIDKNSITVQVKQPDNTAHTRKIAIGTKVRPSPDGQGNAYEIDMKKFKNLFQIKAGVPIESCVVDAYLDAEIGGDRWTGNVVVQGGSSEL